LGCRARGVGTAPGRRFDVDTGHKRSGCRLRSRDGHGAARLSPSPGLAAGQATQVVSHGRHHHNRFSVASEPSSSGLNAPARRRTGTLVRRPHGPRSTPTRGIDLEADLPVAAHLTTLDQAAAHQRLRRRAPRRHRAVRHRPGPGVGHRPGLLPRRRHRILYDRLAARFDIGPGDTLTARLEAIGGLPEFERRPGARISR
jgi:hypothetical protein